MQAMSNNGEESGNAWSCVRNNGNNAWYVNFGNGNCNNNNTNNRYSVWPASEFDKIVDDWLQAERECYKNKHSSFEAAGSVVNSVAASACQNCSRMFVSETPLTITTTTAA